MGAHTRMVGPGVVVMQWTQFQGTPKEIDGRDVFVIRGAKIVFQSVEPKS